MTMLRANKSLEPTAAQRFDLFVAGFHSVVVADASASPAAVAQL
jgi:hypothetical protein